MLPKKTVHIALILALSFIGFMPGAVAASNAPAIYVDGKKLELEVSPVLIKGTTLVPMRDILEALEAEVRWDNEEKAVTAILRKADRGDIILHYKIGDKSATRTAGMTGKNVKSLALDVPGQVIDGKTMIPLRFFSEALGNDVGWEGKSRSITISSNKKKNLRVTRVIDGNTIEVFWANQEDTVRLIGVELPEADEAGYEGKTAAELSADGLTGRLVEVEHNDQERDAEGHVLGYVYLQDGTFFNAKLIAEGYAKAAEPASEHVWGQYFHDLQEDAKANKRGLWADRGEE